MTFKPARLLIALLAVVAVPAFAQNLAVVNGKAIPSSRVDAFVKQVIAQSQGQQQDTKELREEIKQSLIDSEVLMQEAEKQGLGKDPAVKAQLESIRQQILARALIEEFVKKNPVSDADVKAEYDKVSAEAANTKEYHVRHILLKTEAEANDIIAKLKAGGKFEELAKLSIDAGSANTGGDLDWVSPRANDIPPELLAALPALQPGQVSAAPIKNSAGSFHVIKVDETRPVKLPALDQIKEQVRQNLLQKKVFAFEEQLLKKAKVQ